MFSKTKLNLRKSNKRSRQAAIIDQDLEEFKEKETLKKKIKKVEMENFSQEENQYAKIEEVQTIYLTNEQMEGDPLKLFSDLQKKFKQFGAVKVVASDDWKPPFCFKYTDKGITTRIQHINKLNKGRAFNEKEEAYNILTFTNMAQNFQRSYKYKTSPKGSNRQLKNQNQYWNLVKAQNYKQNHNLRVTVQYAADLPVKKYGSGFPLSQNKKTKDDKFDYYKSPFNLNNIYNSPISLMSVANDKKQFISGVTSPWIYMGMMFSSFCWHVEDLWLNSINYSHKGAIKTWYVIPGADKQKFDIFVQKKTGDKELLDKITLMIDPLQVKKAGIRVYKINQTPKSFVCTFFKAYHCGFSQGFNIGEAVNFTAPQSLIYMKQAMQFYEINNPKKPSVLSYDWIVYANKHSKKNFGNYDKLINSEYEKMLKQEQKNIEQICEKFKIRNAHEFSNEYKYDKNSCKICRSYLYLWYVKCNKCDHIYCMKHVHQCCGHLQLYMREVDKDRKYLKKILKQKGRSSSAKK